MKNNHYKINLFANNVFTMDSMVKAVKRRTDGKEFAAKFVGRNRQNDSLTETEFLTLRALHHSTLVKPNSVYLATPKFSIILMEL